MKKISKTATKRLNLSSEKVRTLNDPRLLTSNDLANANGARRGSDDEACLTKDGCGCDCSSMMC